ncbi:MAG: peptidoglycan DD-metalloendopeptidase family protein [Betaproteobacteria bacterium]|nr:peptidoglycan DD-metalloendopeptidase family protein [Betaproteobacteria bacterium]
MTNRKNAIVAAVALALAACSATRPAPVVDTRTPSPTVPAPIVSSTSTPSPAADKPADGGKTHVVQKGETLISIAFQNGLDYRELALWNNIDNPNVIKLGDTLRLTPPGAPAATATATPKPGEPVVTPLVITPAPTVTGTTVNSDKLKVEPKASRTPYSDAAFAKATAEASSPITGTPLPPVAAVAPTAAPALPVPATAAGDRVDWAWPIVPAPAAKQLIPYSELAKGVGITGSKGTAVRAAAAGKVIYTGSHIRGYGRLVIIRHTADWSSAYAHNDKIVVEEGATVKKGDKIAEMGDSDADQVKLHFEIRKNGKPLDPVKMLGN